MCALPTAGQTDCDKVVSSVCREKAKGVTFFEARDGEAVRPMLDVAWAPMLGAFRYAAASASLCCPGKPELW